MKTHFFSIAMAAVSAVLCILPILSGCSRINEDVALPLPLSSADSLSANSEASAADDSFYIYNQLDETEKEYYNIIKDAAMGFEPVAKFPEKVDPDLLKKLFVAVYSQQEDIFWLSSMYYRPSEPSASLALSYRFDAQKVQQMQTEIDQRVKQILSGFTAQTTDYQKIKAFHDYLVLNCSFSENTEYANTVYGGLCDGYAQCEGYAFSFDYLCRAADIDCFSVTGSNREGESHGWNIVKLEGNWYHIDCSWDDPILEPIDEGFIRYYYFLVKDSDIIGVTHIPDNTYFSLPLCTSEQNFYAREGLLAQNADEAVDKLKLAADAAVLDGRKDIAVRFTDKKSYESAVTQLFDNRKISEVISYVNSISVRKFLDKKYVRYCNDDELIIHISMIFA